MFWTGELIARNAPVRRRVTAAQAPHVDRAIAAYLGLAVGDALGATVEFLTPNEIRQQHGVHSEIIGGGWLRLKAGHGVQAADGKREYQRRRHIYSVGGVSAGASGGEHSAFAGSSPTMFNCGGK